jgi:hypothetical protein
MAGWLAALPWPPWARVSEMGAGDVPTELESPAPSKPARITTWWIDVTRKALRSFIP